MTVRGRLVPYLGENRQPFTAREFLLEAESFTIEPVEFEEQWLGDQVSNIFAENNC